MTPYEESIRLRMKRLGRIQGNSAPPILYPLTDKEDYKFKLQGKRVWHDINISIENKKGSTRSGTDPDGKPWSIKMKYDYGRIPRTEGADGDQIDVYMGPDKKSELVFIVHQQDPWKKKYDEDKVFLDFSTKAQVEKAFKGQYDKPGFLGPIDIVSVEVFRDMIKDKSRKGKSIGSSKITDSITNLALGILVEMEHTDNVHESTKIANEHLKEDPNYYLNPKNHFIQEVHKEIMELAKESEAVRGKDTDYKSKLDNLRERRAWTDDEGVKHYDMDEAGNLISDGVGTEILLTPLIKKLMAKLGFQKMRWIGRGWFVPISGGQYGKFLSIIPMLKAFDSQLLKLGYQIRINPLGFFIEPVGNK